MADAPVQLIDQSVRHAVYLERYKGSAVKEYIDILEKIEKYVIGSISKSVTDWNRGRLEKELYVIRQTLETLYKDARKILDGQILDLSSYEVEFEIKSLGKVVSGYDFTIPSDKQVAAAVYSNPMQAAGYQGELLASFYEDMSAKAIKRIEGAIRLGYAQGITTQQLVRDMLSASGSLGTSGKDLTSIVRTAIAHAAQVARQQVWSENSKLVKKVRITATLDGKTSATCRSLDGKIFPLTKGPRPPFHIRCRTTTTAVLDKRFSALSEGRTRSARDPKTGKVMRVSANETYYSWLKRQPASVQDSIVGDTRGKLLRNGGLTSERFAELQLGKNFEPLTLDQMRAIEPIAFEKANI